MNDKTAWVRTWLDDKKQVQLWASAPSATCPTGVKYMAALSSARLFYETEEEARQALESEKLARQQIHKRKRQPLDDEQGLPAAAPALTPGQAMRLSKRGELGTKPHSAGNGPASFFYSSSSSSRAYLDNCVPQPQPIAASTPPLPPPAAAGAALAASRISTSPTEQYGLQEGQQLLENAATAQLGQQPQQECLQERHPSIPATAIVPQSIASEATQPPATAEGQPEPAAAAAAAAAAAQGPAWDAAGSSDCVRLQPGDIVQLACMKVFKDGAVLLTEEQLQLRVVKPLGCGSMSEVYQAELLLQEDGDMPAGEEPAAAAGPVLSAVLNAGKAAGRDVRMLAIKVPRPYHDLPAEGRAAMQCEDYYSISYAALKAELMVIRSATKDNEMPHIARCYGYMRATFGSDKPGLPAVLMQLGEGGSVQQRLTPAPGVSVGMDPEPAWEVMNQMASALVAAHSKAAVVYEDLKPANIVITQERGQQRYLLADFGACSFLGPGNTVEATQVGTLAYMAPEVAAVQEHSITADTFSLGCLLFALRTGKQPWQHLDGVPQAEMVARRTFDELSSLPEFNLFDRQERLFLQAALQHDWKQRPTAQQLLQQEHGYLQAGPSCVLEALLKAGLLQEARRCELAAAEKEDINIAVLAHWQAKRLAEQAARDLEDGDMP